jgi:hypothetical protein
VVKNHNKKVHKTIKESIETQQKVIEKVGKKLTSVIDPLFGVMAFAYANKYQNASASLKREFTPKNCLTKPFSKALAKRNDGEKKQKLKFMPLNLAKTHYHTGFKRVIWNEDKKDWIPQRNAEVIR